MVAQLISVLVFSIIKQQIFSPSSPYYINWIFFVNSPLKYEYLHYHQFTVTYSCICWEILKLFMTYSYLFYCIIAIDVNIHNFIGQDVLDCSDKFIRLTQCYPADDPNFFGQIGLGKQCRPKSDPDQTASICIFLTTVRFVFCVWILVW